MKIVENPLGYMVSRFYAYLVYAEYDDGFSCYVYDRSEEDCMCEIARLVDVHGDCTYYTCVNDEDRVDGEWVGRENFD